MMCISTLSENIDVGTAQLMWERSNFQQDVAERIEAYEHRLKEERASDYANACIAGAIEATISRYRWILRQEIDSEEKLGFMLWLYNGGKLRADNELDIRLAVEERKEQAKRNFFIQNRSTYKKAQRRSSLLCLAIFIVLPSILSVLWGGTDGLGVFLGLAGVPCLLLFSAALAFTLYSVDKEYGYDLSVAPERLYKTAATCFAADIRAYRKIM